MPPQSSRSNCTGYSSGITISVRPRLENWAAYRFFLRSTLAVMWSMTVKRPRFFSMDRTFCASSGRTKLSARIRFTVWTPSAITSGSSELQYCPNRNSSTYTGTFAPSLIFFVRSFRTIFPSKHLRSFCLIVSRVLCCTSFCNSSIVISMSS